MILAKKLRKSGHLGFPRGASEGPSTPGSAAANEAPFSSIMCWFFFHWLPKNALAAALGGTGPAGPPRPCRK